MNPPMMVPTILSKHARGKDTKTGAGRQGGLDMKGREVQEAYLLGCPT